MTKQLEVFTFQSTGETVLVPPVAFTAILGRVRKEMPEPKAPVVQVTIAGKTVFERNYADPDFHKGYALWEQSLELEATQKLLNRVMVKQRLTPEQKEQVKELRQDMQGVEELPESDKAVWFFDIAFGTDEEVKGLLKKAQRQAEPTQEAIAESQNGFRGDLQGQGRVPVSSTA